MPIFRYTLKKILVSPSTWIILLLTILTLSLGWGLFATLKTGMTPDQTWTSATIKVYFLQIWEQMAFLGFIGLMLIIFIAVKATQIFRDEIDDGTLLILVSKPISRNRIWIEKWLSFQAIIVGYLFISILIPYLVLLIPGIGGPVFFGTLLPYIGSLFGISLLFDVILTSVVLLLSLVLNSKATIALMIGFAAVLNIFATMIDQLVVIPTDYYTYSQSVAIYHVVKNKVDDEELQWFLEQRSNTIHSEGDSQFEAEIKSLMKKIYKNDIPGPYPQPEKEQAIIKEIINNGAVTAHYTKDEIALVKHIAPIVNVFRQNLQQTILEIVLGIKPEGYSSGNIISVDNVLSNLQKLKSLPKDIVDNFNQKITQKRIFRYFNIFYQLSYLFNGLINSDISVFNSSAYSSLNDPYIISFAKNSSDQDESVNLDVKIAKIINLSVLITVYTMLGLSLLGSSWYLFNRKDFA